jgi:MoaA/NifB/PqqE/SkfB family radical SAM enzyme
LKELNYRSEGFFFQTDILIQLTKMGYLFAEVPCKLNLRKEGASKMFTLSSLTKIVKDYFRLVASHYFRGQEIKKSQLLSDSSTIKRKAGLSDMRKNKDKMILDGQKLNWHKERVEAWLKGERIAPITIDCALTRRCNYRCVYCYGQLQANDEKRMTRDVIFRFLDDAAEIGVKAISFVSDGESTCSPYLYDAIIRGKNNGLDMALGTNGSLLKEDKLEEILPCLTYLRFNISAGQPGRYAQIMGCREEHFYKVYNTIKEAVKIKKEKNLPVTIGLQMVLMPQFADQIIPFAKLGRELGVDYAVIKHCSDDETGSLGVDYSQYFKLVDLLKKAESFSTGGYLVKVKWSKVLSGGERKYSQCYGPPFIIQMSGSGLVAPCGMLFNKKYKKYHIGNIVDTSFKEIWKSDRYWKVMNLIASEKFDARKMCGTLCLQHKVNECLWDLKKGNDKLGELEGEPPLHINFI